MKYELTAAVKVKTGDKVLCKYPKAGYFLGVVDKVTPKFIYITFLDGDKFKYKASTTMIKGLAKGTKKTEIKEADINKFLLKKVAVKPSDAPSDAPSDSSPETPGDKKVYFEDAVDYLRYKFTEKLNDLIKIKGKFRISLPKNTFVMEYPYKTRNEDILKALKKFDLKAIEGGEYDFTVPGLKGKLNFTPKGKGQYGTKFGPTIYWFIAKEEWDYADRYNQKTDVNEAVKDLKKFTSKW